MANLRIKDQYTNLALDSFGSIQLTTDTPTGNLKIGDSISSIGVKNGLLCVDETLTGVRQGGIRDKFVVPITNNGIITNYQSFINAIRPFNNANFNPNQLTTSLWLDAADASTITEAAGLVSQWDDKSGNNNDATQGGASQPLTGSVSLNGLNALSFDGTDDFFDLTTALTGSDIDIYIIAEGWGYLFADKTTSDNRIAYSATTGLFYWSQDGVTTFNGSSPINRVLNASQINRYTIENLGNSTTEVNAESELSTGIDGDYTINTIGSKWSGATGIPYWTGNISEIIICSSVQSASNKAKIEGYLAWKWGLVSDLPSTHPYKTEPPKI